MALIINFYYGNSWSIPVAAYYDKPYLHPYDGVDEEEHGYQQDHIRQGLHMERICQAEKQTIYLKRLNKGPKQDPNSVTLPE